MSDNTDPVVDPSVIVAGAIVAFPVVAPAASTPKDNEHREAVVVADDSFLTGVINSLIAAFPGTLPPNTNAGLPDPEEQRERAHTADPNRKFVMFINGIASTATAANAQAVVNQLANYYDYNYSLLK